MMTDPDRKLMPDDRIKMEVSKKFEEFYQRIGGDRSPQALPTDHVRHTNTDEDPGKDANKNAFTAEFGGLALVAPYFPVLFRNLNFLDDRNALKENKLTSAAVLLQYLATGEPPENITDGQYFSVLLGLDKPIANSPSQLTSDDFSEADRLLASAMANWPAAKSLGLSGLREGFLKRPAEVREFSANYQVILQSHPLDVILRSLPWSISVSFHPWMKKPLMIEWLS
jgi:hypothetical protein